MMNLGSNATMESLYLIYRPCQPESLTKLALPASYTTIPLAYHTFYPCASLFLWNVEKIFMDFSKKVFDMARIADILYMYLHSTII